MNFLANDSWQFRFRDVNNLSINHFVPIPSSERDDEFQMLNSDAFLSVVSASKVLRTCNVATNFVRDKILSFIQTLFRIKRASDRKAEYLVSQTRESQKSLKEFDLDAVVTDYALGS